MRRRVAVIGAGNVGATLAQLIVQSGLSDVVLYDIVEGMPQGKALDIMEASPLWDVSVTVRGTNELKDTAGSGVVVITAGAARKPGMSRDDLLNINARVVRTVSEGIAEHSPESIVIVVTNPMDVMAQLCRVTTGFHHRRVMGMGGVLDAARFRTFVAGELGVSPQDVDALVLGGHGDQMVPMPRYTTVRGVPVTDLLPAGKIETLIERTRNGGAEIVSLLKTGSAYYAPAASAFQMVRAVLLDEKRLLPAAVHLCGEYGVDGLYVGVPVVVGSRGVERIIELDLKEDERRYFEASVRAVEGLTERLGLTASS
ncbi:MAG TPA: malate dehydrogenase [Nitrospirae bacterium]|nr:malate dehydrogenase [Nitrospirota bacterium]